MALVPFVFVIVMAFDFVPDFVVFVSIGESRVNWAGRVKSLIFTLLHAYKVSYRAK